jgi:hypothetical protein
MLLQQPSVFYIWYTETNHQRQNPPAILRLREDFLQLGDLYAGIQLVDHNQDQDSLINWCKSLLYEELELRLHHQHATATSK